jgi:DNA-binding NarL/FixJ family response regulator
LRRNGKRLATPTKTVEKLEAVEEVEVCIVLDNRVAREALARLLDGVPDVRPVIAGQRHSDPYHDADARILIIDAAVPDSVQAAVDLKSEDPDAKVVVMGLGHARLDVGRFVRAGVSGFILNDATFDEFVDTIRSVAHGQAVLPPGLTDSLFSRIATQVSESHEQHPSKDVYMTSREVEVMQLIGVGHSNREIAQRLGISSDTAKSHVRNIMTKLSLHSRLQIAAVAHNARVT